jgi:hypothetical protein
VNFFQTADLFHNLHLHWPASWVAFIHKVASVFNFTLPNWATAIDPQCSFELTYQTRWLLMMSSPFVVAGVMIAYICLWMILQVIASRLIDLPWCRRCLRKGQISGSEMQFRSSSSSLLNQSLLSPPPAGPPDHDGVYAEPELESQSQRFSTELDVKLEDDSADGSHLVIRRCSGKWWRWKLKEPICSPSRWKKTLQDWENFGPYARDRQVGMRRLEQTKQRLKTIFLGFLMVGYVALGSMAMAPLGCADLYGKRFMISHTSIECNFCAGSTPDVPMGYRWLYILASICSALYGIGIPVLFFYILYDAAHQKEGGSDNLKCYEFTEKYGFLSTKMCDELYAWETVILARKMLLIMITVLSGGHTVRHTLMNLLVVLAASFLQFRFSPFAQMDANIAESLTLVSTVLILVIGLGQQAVQGPSDFVQDQLDEGQDSDDPADKARDQEVLDSFLICCYVVMAMCIFAAFIVILRRLGGVWFMLRGDGSAYDEEVVNTQEFDEVVQAVLRFDSHISLT